MEAMRRILDLLKLPSMAYSYIIAGSNGANNFVKKISFLEEPFPQVEKFINPDEFTFTSFWCMKTDPDNRVNLIKSMIEHKCAGIGIKPSPNLNGEIDQGIID
ncbi:hypothetical protein SDC9_191988 [bioreactor metagenome]|uniref:Purine catabolism PurC-like domain-containing protein n=1 Tax=bioreactor metagenome TaxID=1076179 RepID=A0A645IAH0_9ZZZZ